MFADFIESGGGQDIDFFLTQVSQMPAASQNRILQEKILVLNEKLVNVFEEISNVKKFHQRVVKFMTALKSKISEVKEANMEEH